MDSFRSAQGDELFTLFEPFLDIQEAPFFGETSPEKNPEMKPTVEEPE